MDATTIAIALIAFSAGALARSALGALAGSAQSRLQRLNPQEDEAPGEAGTACVVTQIRPRLHEPDQYDNFDSDWYSNLTIHPEPRRRHDGGRP